METIPPCVLCGGRVFRTNRLQPQESWVYFGADLDHREGSCRLEALLCSECGHARFLLADVGARQCIVANELEAQSPVVPPEADSAQRVDPSPPPELPSFGNHMPRSDSDFQPGTFSVNQALDAVQIELPWRGKANGWAMMVVAFLGMLLIIPGVLFWIFWKNRFSRQRIVIDQHLLRVQQCHPKEARYRRAGDWLEIASVPLEDIQEVRRVLRKESVVRFSEAGGDDKNGFDLTLLLSEGQLAIGDIFLQPHEVRWLEAEILRHAQEKRERLVLAGQDVHTEEAPPVAIQAMRKLIT